MGRRLKIPTSYSDSPWSIMVVWAQEPTNLEISGKIRKNPGKVPGQWVPGVPDIPEKFGHHIRTPRARFSG